MVDPLSVYDSSDDCIAVMEAAGVERAVLIGMSVGGFLSMRCALQYPERVQALVLLSTQAGTDGPEVAEKQQAILMEWLARGLSRHGAQVIEETILGPAFGGADLWKKKWQQMHPAHVLRCSMALATRDDIRESLAEIRTPVLVVHGEKDMAIPLEKAIETHAAFRDPAPLVVVPGAGHCANLTHPEPVNEAIRGFLNNRDLYI
jgi:pimeloyl-ACP methyl ester carboxylesterase